MKNFLTKWKLLVQKILSRFNRGTLCQKTEDHVLFYNVVFDKNKGFPTVQEAVKVDKNLHVRLSCGIKQVHLPTWFVQGRSAKSARISMLHDFLSFIPSTNAYVDGLLLAQLQPKQFDKPGGILYFCRMRFDLLCFYVTLPPKHTAFFTQVSPCHRFQFRQNFSKVMLMYGKLVAQVLHKKGHISTDVILMIDKMTLQKSTQYRSADYVGFDKDGNLS